MTPRQCGRSSKSRTGSHPCEVIPASGCMQFTGCERTARGAPILRQNRADAATSYGWYGVGMWKRAKRAAVANVTTKAPAAALGWGAQHGWFGRNGAHAAGRTSFSAIEIAPALARRMSVQQCSAGHVRPAAGEMGARCSRVFGTAAAAEHSSSAFHRAARHVQRVNSPPPACSVITSSSSLRATERFPWLLWRSYDGLMVGADQRALACVGGGDAIGLRSPTPPRPSGVRGTGRRCRRH